MRQNLYKLEILLLKILPVICAICTFINSIVFVSYSTYLILASMFYVSLIPWIFMYVSSFVFKFCKWHRMPLYYILTNNIFTIIYYCLNIPNSTFIIINIILFGLFAILMAYFKNKQHVKNNKNSFTTNN